jgi:hypothetical protein
VVSVAVSMPCELNLVVCTVRFLLVPDSGEGLNYAYGYCYVIWDDMFLADGYLSLALFDGADIMLCYLISVLHCYLAYIFYGWFLYDVSVDYSDCLFWVTSMSQRMSDSWPARVSFEVKHF